MNILFVASTLPYPLDAGAKIRNYFMAKYLSERHNVHLLSLVRSKDSGSAAAELGTFCASVEEVLVPNSTVRQLRNALHSLCSNMPYTVLANTHPGFRRAIVESVCRYNINAVHFSEFYVANNIPAFSPPVPIVIDAHNQEALILERLAEFERSPLKRWLYRNQAKKMAAFEQHSAKRCSLLFSVSQSECEHFAPYAKEVHLAPNGVELAADSSTARARDLVLFIGMLRYPPNALGMKYFIRHIWPRVCSARPAARLCIISRHIPCELRRQAGPEVELLSGVDDAIEYFRRAAALVVPLFAGGGTRLKILEAFGHSLPVVSTSIGAEGLAVENGIHLLIADDAEAFADAVARILSENDLGSRLAENAAALVHEQYRWELIVKNVSDTYERVFE